MTGPELKASLKALGLTYQALADIANAEREDGRRTSEVTISNQVTGKYPVDPWLALYVRALLERAA